MYSISIWIAIIFPSYYSQENNKKEKIMSGLYFKFGTMNSAKTANLLMAKYNYESQDFYVIHNLFFSFIAVCLRELTILCTG